MTGPVFEENTNPNVATVSSRITEYLSDMIRRGLINKMDAVAILANLAGKLVTSDTSESQTLFACANENFRIGMSVGANPNKPN